MWLLRSRLFGQSTYQLLNHIHVKEPRSSLLVFFYLALAELDAPATTAVENFEVEDVGDFEAAVVVVDVAVLATLEEEGTAVATVALPAAGAAVANNAASVEDDATGLGDRSFDISAVIAKSSSKR